MMFKKKEFAAQGGTGDFEGKEKSSAMAKDDGDFQKRAIAAWRRDSEQLKLIVPEFDLEKALDNGEFFTALVGGDTVIEAYVKTLRQPKSAGRKEIMQNARGARRGTGASTLNPANMTDADFRRYIEDIRSR